MVFLYMCKCYCILVFYLALSLKYSQEGMREHLNVIENYEINETKPLLCCISGPCLSIAEGDSELINENETVLQNMSSDLSSECVDSMEESQD